jgi:DNA-binding NarL/FixJ family response regulator
MRNVLVADDHEVTRRGIRELLRDEFADVTVIEAATGPEVLSRLPTREWDLIILDIIMPGQSILDILRHIRELHPAVPVLVLTAATEVEYVIQTLKAGANGIIHKNQAAAELSGAIRKVANGDMYLHPETAVLLATSLREVGDGAIHKKLSERELEIFLGIARGRAVKEIAGDLDLSEKTVATYIGRIREKTGLFSYVDIARYALQQGLVD